MGEEGIPARRARDPARSETATNVRNPILGHCGLTCGSFATPAQPWHSHHKSDNSRLTKPTNMAPNLAASQRTLIHDMIISKSFTARQIAATADCSIRAVKRFRSNMRVFGTMKAPWNHGGRRRSITPSMLDALREHLLEKPTQYLDEMC